MAGMENFSKMLGEAAKAPMHAMEEIIKAQTGGGGGSGGGSGDSSGNPQTDIFKNMQGIINKALGADIYGGK